VLAWPRCGDEGDLERLLGAWAECLASCESTCLCLRHDEATELEVLLVDGPMGPDEHARLGMAVEAAIEVEGCDDPAREAFLNLVSRPRMTTPEAV